MSKVSAPITTPSPQMQIAGQRPLAWPLPSVEGDVAPIFMLRDHGGQGWSLTSDIFAGRPIVLVFVQGPSSDRAQTLLHAFRDCAEDFDRFDATLAIVTRQTCEINAAARIEQKLPFHLLSDVLGTVTRSYQALCDQAPETDDFVTCVLSPALRIVRLISGPKTTDHAKVAIAAVESLLASRRAEPMSLHPPILQIPDVLSSEECQFLTDLHGREDVPWNEPGDPENRYDFRIRVGDHRRSDRIDYVINDPSVNERLDQHLMARIAPQIKKAYQYDINQREPYHIARYRGARGGHSIGHRDNPTADVAHRRFALSINLSPEHYEGGELRFREYGEQRYKAPRGAALIFSSSLLHEVLTVTAGTRYVLLSHLYNEPDKQRPTPRQP